MGEMSSPLPFTGRERLFAAIDAAVMLGTPEAITDAAGAA
jgi:3-mercaptopropionate dioxygenase